MELCGNLQRPFFNRFFAVYFTAPAEETGPMKNLFKNGENGLNGALLNLVIISAQAGIAAWREKAA